MEGTAPKPRKQGRRRDVAHPKGRQVEPGALAEVRETLGDAPRRRDLLIEHLHALQDRYRAISAAHLAALAAELKLSQAEVYEVATFYAHFDVLAEGDEPPPAVTVRVCDGVACLLAGCEGLRQGVAEAVGGVARVVPAPCMGLCDRAPAVAVGHNHFGPATVEAVAAAVEEGRVEPEPIPEAIRFDAYREAGGYRLLKECLEGRRGREAVVEAVEKSGLRGLGGAGFRTGLKWSLVRQSPGRRLMAINADEGEPGTFKDRHYLESDPHRFLEGMLVAAWAVEAEEIYIYLRDEYPGIRRLLRESIADLSRLGLSLPPIHLRRGAGAYICGEETAMLESLEGKRGYPRQKPPFPTQVGLFGRPTLIHNVETVYWVRDIVEGGPAAFDVEGRRGRRGLRSFSVSGRVREPGVKRAPAGISVRELIDEYCGGMAPGHAFAAYLPGGASGGIFPASLGDLALDFGTLEEHGGFIGSAAIVVLSDQDDVRAVALNLMRFFEDESCGQCTPCRVGTEKAVALMSESRWDEPLLTELGAAMRDASICGLGQAAPNPLLCILRHFPEPFDVAIRENAR